MDVKRVKRVFMGMPHFCKIYESKDLVYYKKRDLPLQGFFRFFDFFCCRRYRFSLLSPIYGRKSGEKTGTSGRGLQSVRLFGIL